MNDINQTLQGIFAMKKSGKNPQMILQMLMQQNPQVAQLMTQFRNMSKGQNPRDFSKLKAPTIKIFSKG